MPSHAPDFFLDNVDLRGLSKNHSIIPHIKVFDAISLKRMTTMCARRGYNDFSDFLGIRSAQSSVYMRHTYESEHQTTSFRVQIAPKATNISASTIPHTSSDLNPDTYNFSSPSDFGAYIRAKYPALQKDYAVSWFQMQNALFMQEVAKLRQSIMRRNAHFFDWFVHQLGQSQVHLLHKPNSSPSSSIDITPAMNSPLPNVQTSTPNSGHNSKVPIYTPTTTLAKPVLRTQNQSVPPTPEFRTPAPTVSAHNTTPHGKHTPPSKLAAPSKTSKRKRHDIVEPSFDLGIAESPSSSKFTTPKQLPAQTNIHAPSSPIQIKSPITSNNSYSLGHLSPKSGTINHASTVLFECLATLDDSNSDPSLCFYGQPVQENLQKIGIPSSPVRPALWSSVAQHHFPEPDVVDLFVHWLTTAKHELKSSNLVVHSFPRQITINLSNMKDYLSSSTKLDDEIIDVILRRFNQLDADLTDSTSVQRWRHFLESDFGMISIGGGHSENYQSVLNQFIYTDHFLLHCTMIIAPVLIHNIWTVYMLNMSECKVHILDPIHSTERAKLHDHFFKDTINTARAVLLFEALSIQANEAVLPPVVRKMLK